MFNQLSGPLGPRPGDRRLKEGDPPGGLERESPIFRSIGGKMETLPLLPAAASSQESSLSNLCMGELEHVLVIRRRLGALYKYKPLRLTGSSRLL